MPSDDNVFVLADIFCSVKQTLSTRRNLRGQSSRCMATVLTPEEKKVALDKLSPKGIPLSFSWQEVCVEDLLYLGILSFRPFFFKLMLFLISFSLILLGRREKCYTKKL